ncbi:hypothetical protein Y1Q_0005066 [Alligator mississippiensis]|uniref:Uncharacterized protein n=1 Tax=Alligator mississippiensis TaxID=8496 RepID=A0A151NB86_ALLMI|nr:hypothetical protein Y1Q_0005066 [Alligator mississippiensis]
MTNGAPGANKVTFDQSLTLHLSIQPLNPSCECSREACPFQSEQRTCMCHVIIFLCQGRVQDSNVQFLLSAEPNHISATIRLQGFDFPVHHRTDLVPPPSQSPPSTTLLLPLQKAYNHNSGG